EAVYRATWGDWFGREAEFYKAAYELVRGLDRKRFANLVGITHDVELDRLIRRRETIVSPTLPERLVRNPALKVHRLLDGSAVLTTSDAGETTRLRGDAVRLLDLFDGRRSNEDVKALVASQAGVRVGDSFLLALYQHRVLMEA